MRERGREGSMRHQLSAEQNAEEMAFLHPVQEVWEGSVCGCEWSSRKMTWTKTPAGKKGSRMEMND